MRRIFYVMTALVLSLLVACQTPQTSPESSTATNGESSTATTSSESSTATSSATTSSESSTTTSTEGSTTTSTEGSTRTSLQVTAITIDDDLLVPSARLIVNDNHYRDEYDRFSWAYSSHWRRRTDDEEAPRIFQYYIFRDTVDGMLIVQFNTLENTNDENWNDFVDAYFKRYLQSLDNNSYFELEDLDVADFEGVRAHFDGKLKDYEDHYDFDTVHIRFGKQLMTLTLLQRGEVSEETASMFEGLIGTLEVADD